MNQIKRSPYCWCSKVIVPLLVLSSLFFSLRLLAAEFVQESTQDYSIKTKGILEITNTIGDTTLRGWALDKIRVKVRKIVEAKDKEEAKTKFETVSFRYRQSENGIELSSQYGDRLSIEDRLRQKHVLQIKLSFTVYAPSKMIAKIWGINGSFDVKNWNSDLYLRLKRGRIEVEGLSANQISTVCLNCEVSLRNIQSSIRVTGEQGATHIQNAEGQSVFVETDSGNILLDQIEGAQTFLAKSGDIKGEHLAGDIDFRTVRSNVVLKDVKGSVSGAASGGSIIVGISKWDSSEKSTIETVSGGIEVTLPWDFSANVDLRTEKGTLTSSFPIEADQTTDTAFVAGLKHARGRVGDGGELFALSSKTGDVSVIKGEF